MPYVLREALAAFQRAPLLTGLSCALIGLSLFVVGLFGLAAYNIGLVLDQVESRVEVVAYLGDGTPQPSVELLLDDVTRMPEVREAFYITRDQALELARRELADFSAIFTDLEVNPLPASVEVRLSPGHRDPASVERVAERVATFPFVEDVRYGRDWLDKVFLLRRVAGASSLILGATFAAVAALIIGAAVRIAIFARREEIAIMRLVGATEAFVRGPFLLEGLITGVAGAVLALLATFLIFRVLGASVIRLEWLPATWIAAGIAMGVGVGMVASAVAIRRYMRLV